uniref:uncharacterized protein LOC120332630 isoform X2 n=1 Tax=Styela clava TaxID=7725 RepID=UPI001939FF9E|nr:uncharacterized protein LOC120332630 isoform X2 [Styela clava]
MNGKMNLGKLNEKENTISTLLSTLNIQGTNEFCPEWTKELDWNGPTITPLMQLDPTRIIYPANRNGPSDELISLQEAIFIGMETNRTVVIPPFKPHPSDKDSNYDISLPASLRVDLKILSRLVSLTTVDKMQQLCNSSFDIGFEESGATCLFRKFLKETSGMSLNSSHKHLFGKDGFSNLTFFKNNSCDPPSLPVRKIPFRKFSVFLRNVKDQFKSDMPCAVLINTHKNPSKLLRNPNKNILKKAMTDLSSVTQEDISDANCETKYKLIEVFTRKPRFVRELASEFIREVMKKQEYLALHWRYNFEFRCRSRFNFCPELKTVETSNISKAILFAGRNFKVQQGIKNLSTHCQSPEIVNFYLATAATDYETIKHQTENANFQKEFFQKIAKNKGDKEDLEYYMDQRCWKIQLFTKLDLYRFISSKYPEQKCSAIWRDTHELISLVENELCKQSVVFIHSPKSVWSEIARQTRTINLSIWDVFSEINKLMNTV